MKFKIEDLQEIFNSTFRSKYRTRLEYGHNEPFYKAIDSLNTENIIYSREDFFASGLHEVAHWCIAGEKRRKEDDYGYWYSNDDRSIEEQLKFEKVEVKPQALEKAFCAACNFPFKASLDNHSLTNYNPDNFINDINKQFNDYTKNGFPKRAEIFIKELKLFYKVNLDK